MSNTKYYICEKCGNLVEVVNASGVPMVCCGQKMTYLEPGTVEASREKHIPVVKVDGNLVRAEVGSVTHPMSEEHSILWISLETDRGVYRKHLAPTDAPVAEFALADGEVPVAIFAYCNLHGLWKVDI